MTSYYKHTTMFNLSNILINDTVFNSFSIYASVNWVTTGSGNGLLSMGLLGTNFNEILIRILYFSFKKIDLKMSSARMGAILPKGR